MIDQNIYSQLLQDIPETPVLEVMLFHQVAWVKTPEGVGVSSYGDWGFCSPPKCFGALEKKSLRELASYFLSDNYLEVAVGMAAINAHYNQQAKVASANFEMKPDFNAYDFLLQSGADKNVAIIGGFPFIEKIKDQLGHQNLWVFELRPTKDYHISVDRYAEFLPRADIVILTATTLLNRTFHQLLPHIKNSYNIMTGPTAPLTQKLFDHSISVLAGMVVVDQFAAFKTFSQGTASKNALGVQKVSLLRA